MKESITRSLREILAESHIAAIAIAILLVWSLDSALRAHCDPALSEGCHREG
jgi:hypothetical protein